MVLIRAAFDRDAYHAAAGPAQFCIVDVGNNFDLTDGVRAHLYKCDMVSETVRRRAQAVRAASERLVKESYELGDAADVLRREVETALQALQEAMRQSSPDLRPSDSRAEA